jgi:5-methylcytosine-specific restriction endonuclease McrA
MARIAAQAAPTRMTCMDCGQPFETPYPTQRYCSNTCQNRATRTRRRARKREAFVEEVWRSKVFERDGWICGICGDPVNRDAKVPELDAPVMDHIVPLAQGGEHSYSNTQCAHFYCNSVKRDLPMSEVA